MRICILTKADTLCWTQHYVDAFRERAEVLTIGPAYDPQQLDDFKLENLAHTLIPNDIETDLHPEKVLREILPEGWEPDLIVTIASGGTALQPDMRRLHCPTAYITVDTWQSISDYVECQHYDFVFAAQKSYVDRLRAAGGANVRWLPLACNPAAHYPVDVQPDFDVSFVGTVAMPVHNVRYNLLQKMAEPFTVIGQNALFRDDLCRMFARGKLAFNHSAVEDLNMRVFEAMAMKRALLTNRDSMHNGLLDLFEEGKHLIVYDNESDLLEKVRYYLDHDDEREAIAQAGYELVLAKHRYIDRIDELLATVNGAVPGPPINRFNSTVHPVTTMTPHGAKRILDFGGWLSDQGGYLRARGAESIVAFPATESTDVALSGDDWDVVAVQSTEYIAATVAETLERVYGLLVLGGTLIIRLTARDFSAAHGLASLEQLNAVFLGGGFHVLACEVEQAQSGEMAVIVKARKRTRTLVETVNESLARYPQIDPADLVQWAETFGPGY